MKKLDESKARWFIRQKEGRHAHRAYIPDYGNLHILDQEDLGKIQARR